MCEVRCVWHGLVPCHGGLYTLNSLRLIAEAGPAVRAKTWLWMTSTLNQTCVVYFNALVSGCAKDFIIRYPPFLVL